MTRLEDLSNANKARWELARILLNKTHGDIEKLHIECVEVANRLMADAEERR